MVQPCICTSYILPVILCIVNDLSICCLFIQSRSYAIDIVIVRYHDTGNVFQVFQSQKEVTTIIRVNKHHTSQDSCLIPIKHRVPKAYCHYGHKPTKMEPISLNLGRSGRVTY
jgi:hypothetical protein